MKRKAARRIWAWIVLLTFSGTFLSTNVYDAVALESEQEENLDMGSSPVDDQDDAIASNPDSNQTNQDSSQADQNSSQTNQDSNQTDQDSNQADQNSNQTNQDSNQADQDSNQTNQDSNQTNQDSEQIDMQLPGIEENVSGVEGSPEGAVGESGFTEEDEIAPNEADKISELGGVNPEAENDPDESIYVLYITHTLLYNKDGKGRHVQASSQVQLAQEDFEDGSYGLMKHAYDWEAVTTSPGPGCPEQISIEEFWDNEKGEKEYYAEIRYVVKEGWEVRFSEENGSEGSMFYSIYEGPFDSIEFVPIKSITLTINYKYSNTGGLAGIDAHAPDVVVLPLKDGKADLENWRIPHSEGGNNSNLEGFRIVLDPDPLNAFLVNPEAAKNPSAYPDALENGDFNLRPDVNTGSQEYQEAWDAARTTTVDGITFTYIAPTANGGTGATTSDDSDKQYTLNASGLTKDLTLTIYYRRDMGMYTVNYWKRASGASGGDELIKSMEVSGRVGALTSVKPLEDHPEGFLLESIAQKTIAADGSTVVDVYYSASLIRVIFDTDYIYIPRQQVATEGYVDFNGIDEEQLNAARAGYKFTGWQYEDKNGNRQDIQLTTDKKLQLTSEFLEKANIAAAQETDDVKIRVLNLYPKWEEDLTAVRVIFWTENLNGQDVKVTDSYYDFNTGKDQDIIRGGYNKIQHQDYSDADVIASYTNAGSFSMNGIKTNQKLTGEDGKLITEIQDEIEDQLSLLGSVEISWGNTSREVELSDFYKQQGFTIMGGGEKSLFAAADGSTQINVFFERKEYTLDFIYYFLPAQTGKDYTAICTNTEAFYHYTWPSTVIDFPNATAATGNVEWKEIRQTNNGKMMDSSNREVPRRTLITAKYGADLRSVWPGAEDVSTDSNTRYILSNQMRVSWTTTAGNHNAMQYGGNYNVPGAYSTMSAAIVANSKDSSVPHHLVAFWKNITNNTYRYNYCYEVPDLQPEKVKEEGLQVSIIQKKQEGSDYVNLDPEAKEIKNSLYLVPVNDPVFEKYGFTDLLTYDELALQNKEAKKPEGLVGEEKGYYVIRIYNNKCYAVSRQLVVLSALGINQQNPSSRPNLTLVNSEQDHNTELNHGNSAGNGGYNSPNNPYDIYFYYKRTEFTITYMSNGITELGKITLPYGARLYEKRYNIQLDDKETARYYASERKGYAAWTTTVNVPVCPARSEDDTRTWKFERWSLAPSGNRPMEWDTSSDSEPIVINGNFLLYAEWADPYYTVEFDWNGGSIPSTDDENYEKKLQSQKLPANQSFVKSGLIPRPIREGYILQGWQITDKGQVDGDSIKWISASVNGSFPEFHFDEPITCDLKVQAVWIPSGTTQISYTVYYLDKETEEPVAAPKKVTGTYRVGTIVWERPAVPTAAGYRNYVPLKQNQSITLDTLEENELVFYYETPSGHSYRVKFVELGTNKEILSDTYTTKSASLLVCPEKEQVEKLDKLGYWIVNDRGEPEENGASLGKNIRLGAEVEPEAVFYVLPREYEIFYTNLEVMGEAAADELRSKNPASYTSKDPNLPRTLKNPDGSYLFNGNEFCFLGWRLVDQTKETGVVTGETPDFGNSDIAGNVTIQPGSRGRLIFQAVWTHESYVVYFYPGDCGTFPDREAFIDFGGLISNTPLAGNITVPTVVPNGDNVFIGWRWEEGEDRSRVYTEEEILAMHIEKQDMHFTACYWSEQESNLKGEVFRKQEVLKDEGGSDSLTGSSGSGSSDSLVEAEDFDNPDSKFSVSDSYERTRAQRLPQTGMDWLPAWGLGVLGILFLCMGIRSGRKQKKEKAD